MYFLIANKHIIAVKLRKTILVIITPNTFTLGIETSIKLKMVRTTKPISKQIIGITGLFIACKIAMNVNQNE